MMKTGAADGGSTVSEVLLVPRTVSPESVANVMSVLTVTAASLRLPKVCD